MDKIKQQNIIFLIPDLLVFLSGTILQFVVVYLFVPMLSKTGIMKLGSWMILSIPCIFTPIIIGAIIILLIEKNNQKILQRLWINKFSKKDLLWLLIGFLILLAGSAIAFMICHYFKIETNPPFARNVQTWLKGNTWMFFLWFIYWPINIIGEEFVWRSVILPRMEIVFGNFACIFNTVLWGIFHLAFGYGNLIVLIPTLIVVPFIVQKTKNTWTGIILHSCLSLPGFIALAFGLMY